MASTRGRPLFNCFRAHVHACTRCLSKVAPFQQPFMEANLNVQGGPGPLAGSDGPGCDAAAWHVSGPPDSKPVSCTSYIYCHCHDSGTLMSLNVSIFSAASAAAGGELLPVPVRHRRRRPQYRVIRPNIVKRRCRYILILTTYRSRCH